MMLQRWPIPFLYCFGTYQQKPVGQCRPLVPETSLVFPAPAGGSILVPSYTKTLDTVAAKPFLETLTDTMQP